MSFSKQLLGLFVWLAVTFAAAAAGAAASTDSPEFYRQLARPAWAPPAWLFGPVWTVLYGMMAVAAWLVWRHPRGGFRRAPLALGLFLAQLVLNGLWSWIFFVWRQGAFALADILVLSALIFATIVTFRRVQPLAAGLLLPYLAWVTYAAALTFALWRMNPELR